MSKPRYAWWGYVKNVLRRYPDRVAKSERMAVENALDEISILPTSAERRIIIDTVYIRKTHTLEGAAIQAHVSYETAKIYNRDAIRLVAEHLGLPK